MILLEFRLGLPSSIVNAEVGLPRNASSKLKDLLMA